MPINAIKTVAGDINIDDLGVYRCHKTVHTTPMTRGEYNHRRGWVLPSDENASDPGYLVIYNLEGVGGEPHISWSPAEVFHEGYTLLPEGVTPGREQYLFASAGGGCLNISIGVDLIAHAISVGPGGIGGLTVTDADVFASELASALLREEEDGTTPVHRMLDEVAELLAVDGADGIQFDDEEDE